MWQNLDKTQIESWKNVQKCPKILKHCKMWQNLDKTQIESWRNVQNSKKNSLKKL